MGELGTASALKLFLSGVGGRGGQGQGAGKDRHVRD